MRALLLTVTAVGCTYGVVACSSSDSGGGSSGTPVPTTTTTSTSTAPVPPAPPPPTPPAPPPPPPVDGGVDAAPLPAAATPTFSPAAGTFTAAQSVSIATTTAGADIFYTTDGTNPTSASTVYSSPLSIAKTTTIRAIAIKTGFSQSAVAAGVFTINIAAGGTESPTFIPTAGTYGNTQSVALSTGTVGATICYTADGTTPAPCAAGVCGAGAATYNGASPITVSTSGTTVKALACKAGNTDSAPVTASYNFKASNATVVPAVGIVPSGQVITLSTATVGGVIHYTSDGSTPTCLTGTTVTDSGNTPAITANTTIKTIVCKATYASSDVGSFDYQVRAGDPVFSAAANTYPNDQSITITGGAGSNLICYTTDGSAPSCVAGASTCATGTKYTAAVAITKDNTTLTAVDCGAANITSAPPVAATYTLKVDDISVNGSTSTAFYQTTNGTNVGVTLATTTTGGTTKICYRTDGTSPTCAADPANLTTAVLCGAGSTTYSAPFNLTSPFDVRAIGCKPNYQNSTGREATFGDAASSVVLSFVPGHGPGAYNNDVTAQMAVQPADATICYQQGAQSLADPVCNVATATCTTGQTYDPANPPLVNADSTWFKARACRLGFANQSTLIQGRYDLNVAPVTVTLGPPASGGGVFYGQLMNFTSPTNGVTFHYNVGPNFAFPGADCSSGTTGNNYRNVKDPNTNFTLSIIACKAGYQPSVVTNSGAWYSWYMPAPPSFDLAGGTYTDTQTLHLATVSDNAPGAVICYSTDGTGVSCNPGSNICQGAGNVVSGPASGTTIPINTSQTVNAVSCGTGFYPSNYFAGTGAGYTLNVSPLTVSPPGGTYTTSKSVTIAQQIAPPAKTPGASICYTTDGSLPATTAACAASNLATTCSTAATVNVSISTTTSLRYRGCRAAFNPYDATANYTINAYSRTIAIDGANDFVDAENKIATTDAGYTAYLSWDAASVYVGLQGTGIGTNQASNYAHVYWAAAGNPTTTTPDNLGGGEFGATALPVGMSYHALWRTDGADSRFRRWNGASWVAAGGISVASGGAGATSYVELAIGRGVVGTNTLTIAGGYNASGANVATWPSGGAAWAKYVQADMSSFLTPNDASYVKP